MVPLGLPSARPMAQALRLPFEYYIIFIIVNNYNFKFNIIIILFVEPLVLYIAHNDITFYNQCKIIM